MNLQKLCKFSIFIFVFHILIFACDRPDFKEFYENGTLKSEFFGKLNPKAGTYKEYFRNGNIKKVEIFENDIKIDSSILFFEEFRNLVHEIRYYSKNSITKVIYDESGKIIKRGRIIRNHDESKIGKWIFSDYKTNTDSIVEYIIVDNKSYVNQIWFKTFSGDTIFGRGNYLEIIKGDSVNLGEVVRLKFILTEPFYGIQSDIVILLPKDSRHLKDDYSNLQEIEWDTLHSLKNDGIQRHGIPPNFPSNQIIEFGIDYNEPGFHEIRGVLVEYGTRKLENHVGRERFEQVERRLFFKDSVFVKDKSND